MKKAIIFMAVFLAAVIVILAMTAAAAELSTPEVELRLTDTNQVFAVKIVDNKARVSEGPASDPDIVFRMASSTFVTIFDSKDPGKEAYKQFKNKNIYLHISTSYSELVLKGYINWYKSVKE